MNEKKIVYEYNIMRIIGILTVVIGHSIYLNMSAAYGGVDYTGINSLGEFYNTKMFAVVSNYLVNPIYFFHMPMMFAVSGAVFCVEFNNNRYSNFGEFVINKSQRLLIPYLFYGILWMFPIKLAARFYTGSNIGYAIISFLSGIGSMHLWFLTTLFWIFIISWILIKQFNTTVKLICIIICIYTFSHILNSFGLPGGVSITYYLLFFFAGFYFEKIREWYNSRSIAVFFGFTLVLYLIAYYLYHWVGFIDTTGIPWLNWIKAAGILICCLIVYNISHILVHYNIVNTKIYTLLNKYSFDVYLLHDPMNYLVLYFVSGWLYYRIDNAEVLFSLMWMMRTILISVISIIIAAGIKQLKSRFSMNWKRPLLLLIIVVCLFIICYFNINSIGIETIIYTPTH